MSAAYFKLLHEPTDPEFHDALIRSQRRWLEVRDHIPDRSSEKAEGDTTDDRDIWFVTHSRMTLLQSGDLILTMEQQRKIRLQDSGGAFAGYKTQCVLENGIYECWGNTLRQNNDRICSTVMERASDGNLTEHRAVSVLKNGEQQVVATCSTGYAATSDKQCPLPHADVWNKLDGHWNTTLTPSDNLTTLNASDLWKYDPDFSPNLTDQRWFQDCLFAPTYPPLEVSRPNSKSDASGR